MFLAPYFEENVLSKSLKLVNFIRFRIPRTYVEVQKQLTNIHMYPAFSVEILADASVLA